MKATIMTSRLHKLLAACAAFAFVVPTTLLAQQPTNLQLHNINAGAVGGRWLLQPGTATSGLYQLMLPNTNGTLIANTGSGTVNRMTRWTGPSTLGDASLDDDGSGVLSRTGTIQINPGTGNTLSTNGSVTVNSAGAQDLVITESALTRSGGDFTISLVPAATLFNTGNLDVTGNLTVDGQVTLGDGSDAISLNAGVGTITLSGATNINNAGGPYAVNINTAANASTTTIGNNTASNTLTVNSPVVNMANLPATGVITDELVTTNGTVLRTATVTTMLGGTPWLLGGNTTGVNQTIGTNDGFELGLETSGSTRMTIAAGGNVGIGTAPTTDRLVVDNTINVSGTTPSYKVSGNNFLWAGAGGTDNTLVGHTGNTTISGSNNVGLGRLALLTASTGSNNTALGVAALRLLTTGGANTAIGFQALFAVTTTSNNVGIGQSALFGVIGSNNTAVGTEAGNKSGPNSSGSNNTFIGYQTGNQNTGSSNVFIGSNVANSVLTGVSNTLAIDNSATLTPLVSGDFSTDQLTLNVATGTAASLSVPGTAQTAAVATPNVRIGHLGGAAVTNAYVGNANNGILVADVNGDITKWDEATVIGNMAWLVGGNSLGAAGSIGTNDANDLNIETGGTTRFTVTAAGALNQQAGGGNISLTGNVGIEAAPVNSRSLTASKTTASVGANIGAVGYASGGAGNCGVLGAVGANAADIVALEGVLASTTSNAGVSGYNHLGAGNNFGVAAYADQNNGNALVATAAGNNGLGIMVAANIGTGTTGMQIDASGTGIVLNSSTLGLNIQTGGATILGATNINNSGGPFAVNINTAANASTTTIGNNTASNTVTVNAPVVNMANLPAGVATDALITTDGTALRETSVATMLGNTAWLVGGNTLGAPGAIGTNDAFDLLLEANGTTRMTIAQAGTILMDPNGDAANEYSFASTQLTINTDGTAGVNDLLIAEGALSRTGNIAINPGAGNDVTTNGGLTVAQDFNVNSTTNQIVLGTGNTTTITSPAPAASRTYTIPDAGANASFVLTEGTQTINGSKTHLGNIAINNSGAGTTDIGTSATAGTVTLGSTGNGVVVNSDQSYTPSAPVAIGGGGMMAVFTTSFVRQTITEGGGAYNVQLQAGTNDGQIVYLRLFFDENVGGGNTVTIQGVGGAPNFFTWAGTADENYLMHLIWDATAGEWQILANQLQP